jgi:hypothetical protein
MTKKYYLSVGAIFKNEAHILKEWIEHYLFHGVEHFYLINDNSHDNFLNTIQEYIDNDIITLFNVNEPYYLGRQRNLYNRHILPNISETQWLLICDLDEFIWSQKDINLGNVLKIYFQNMAQIQIHQFLFGSNGHIKQPKYVVKEFTKRRINYIDDKKYKYIVNSSYDFTSLNIHHAEFKNKDYINDLTKFIIINPEYFVNNHYNCQSQEFWNSIKCTRGDCDNFLKRTSESFKIFDINEIDDLQLYNQNLNLFI